MGIKGLSKNVIKQVWREDSLKSLPAGTRVGVDVAGWLHKAVVSNATDIVREKGTTSHHNTMVRFLQQLLTAGLAVVLVFDGGRWPLKSGTHARRASARVAALEKADEAVAADDWVTADKFYKQAVRVPDEFVSWVIEHVKNVPAVRVVVANYEADAQLAKLAADGEVDIVYSAAQDSDFLLYSGMGDIMYDLRGDGTFHRINFEADVLGKAIGQFNFRDGTAPHFRLWSAACGCDYVDNPPGWGAIKLHKLVYDNLSLSEAELIRLIASKATDATSYAVDLLAAVRSFSHQTVFERSSDGVVKQVPLTPLPEGVDLSSCVELSADQCARVYSGELDPITLGPRAAPQVTDDPNAPALEADFSSGQRPAQYSVPRLRQFLVNRGIPLPSLMRERAAVVELVELVLSYPRDTWPIIAPWAAEMAGWTRPDPVVLDSRPPLAGDALWTLLHSEGFPKLTDGLLDMLMPRKWENTRERGQKLYLDGMCRVGQLSVSFASGAGGEECWCFRMPVHASMRGNYWQARLTISGSRVYLAPSSGCECENGCVACSHQVALFITLRRCQDCGSFAQFQSVAKAFAADTLASGAVHWWHLLFPLGERRSRRRARKAMKQAQQNAPAGDLEMLATREQAHPFQAAAARASDEAVLLDSRPLYAPGSDEHRGYVERVLGTGSFSRGMAAQVVRLDPAWRSSLDVLGWGPHISVSTGDDQPLSDECLGRTPPAGDAPMLEVSPPSSPMSTHSPTPSPAQPASPGSSASAVVRRLLGSRPSPTPRSRSPRESPLSDSSPPPPLGRRMTLRVRRIRI
jgi:hypothetical protein